MDQVVNIIVDLHLGTYHWMYVMDCFIQQFIYPLAIEFADGIETQVDAWHIT